MAVTEAGETCLSRGIDYLGDLGSKLRDLKGYGTLACELVQNADDAEAESIVFYITDDGLIVDNDKRFTDCGAVQSDKCVWTDDPEHGHKCDFHRFRVVGSGDKRRQDNTTGAFGFGFTAVYQVTDRPELISNNRHWTLREEEDEARRIFQCGGCARCQGNDLPGTRFYLPWANDENSSLRKALSVEAFTEGDRSRLQSELLDALPTAILFLRNIERIEVHDAGIPVLQLERIVDGNKVLVTDGVGDSVWHLVHGSFVDEAEELRRRFPNGIEAKRKSHVTVAIPEESIRKGRLSACLPTDFLTGLEFHVNADFYPTRDRKRIILETDYQSEWNRSAIEASAKAVSQNLPLLAKQLGHARLWQVINSVYQANEEVKKERIPAVFESYWDELKESLRGTPVFYTVEGEWRTADRVVLLQEKDEEAVIPILQSIGISIIHPDLRPYHNLLRNQEVGVGLLDLESVVCALEVSGLTVRHYPEEIPQMLREKANLALLWAELERLLTRRMKSEVAKEGRARLANCALALAIDGALWPCSQVYRADSGTQELFRTIDASVPFLDACGEPGSELESLCPEFTASHAAEILGRHIADLIERGEEIEFDVAPVIRWFENRREEVLSDETLRDAISKLPIFPTAQCFRPLDQVVLPGGYEDPLGLAEVLDLSKSGARRDFLRDLGARELSFPVYVTEHLPGAIQGEDLSAETMRSIIRLLADRIGEIRDDFEVEEILSELRLVECVDGEFRRPRDTFFEVSDLTELFGEQANQAKLPRDHAEAIRGLFVWLGVSDAPSLADIAERVRGIVTVPPTPRSVRQINMVFAHLGRRVAGTEHDEAEFSPFGSLAWLPGRGNMDKWFRPREVYPVFNDYLFESQATFLNIERNIQKECADLIRLLGIPNQPTVPQVADHLLWCSANGQIVNKDVYRWLNDHAESRSVGRLTGEYCLLLPDGDYVRPDQVFWGEHQFGHFRYRLGSDMRAYGRLLEQLGVKESPDHEDALAVIREIEQKYAPGNLFVDESDQRILLNCWQLLADGLDALDEEGKELAEEIRESVQKLSSRKVISDRRGLLCRPGGLFFGDRPGLAAKFDDTLGNDIISRPHRAWRAMEVAGVRHLSDAVHSEVVERSDPRSDTLVTERIQERRNELRRVLEAHSESSTEAVEALLFEQILCNIVDELVVQYRVEGLYRLPPSAPEVTNAHYHRESQTLYSRHSDGVPPWAAIARELALALSPGAEPGGLASGIKEVLVADDARVAKEVLDELGYILASEEVEPNSATNGDTIQDFGGEEHVESESYETPDEASSPQGESPVVGDEDMTAREQMVDGEAINPAAADEAILGQDARTPSPPPGDLTGSEVSRGTRSGDGRQTGSSQGIPSSRRTSRIPRKRERLRTYVVHRSNDDDGRQSGSGERDDSVDEAGMAHVLAFEREEGRDPKPMHQTNPGYDIESYDDAGKIERIIEVKSLSGTWDTLGAALTDTQFEKATKEGSKYWLYVVERAECEDFCIYRIQDPARKVNQFIFDDGWRALAEESEQTDRAQEDWE